MSTRLARVILNATCREMIKQKTSRHRRGRLEDALGFLLADATRTMNRAIAARLTLHGLPLGLFPFLRALCEQDGVSQKDLADRLRFKGPTAVAAIRQLERGGLVHRVSDPDDGRRSYLYVTTKGRELYDKVIIEVEDVMALCTRAFSRAEHQQFTRFLKRMRANLIAGAAKPLGHAAPIILRHPIP